ncbi:MAG TPA: proline--tRNA ligase [Methanospirillum sp.]|uniref:proline--tRNA ligase n=1 Tax=Methanospirillum sp. TaxID=45200 RepID=UPI002BE640BE|nr:proline--tRNA ligase [Methanospirillum sp.]HOJ95434.1 proline--tRNA ligase [Methanospirillum sp.]HOL41651.1 proline--tRNA ligase [Methanospirillum sp.]HPP76888.1 proline--tRNA ligase [Methanospirillum sp.]
MEEQEGTLPQKADFSSWYNDILWRAEIMDVRYPVKGLYVWFPFGFGIRKRVYGILRELLDRDHEETLFPLLIPEPEFMKEAEHIKGFEDEVYWVTHGGKTPLDIKLALRPTSETAIYPMYALWVRSHADLPIKVYQIVNTFRYETKHTRPLIRLREITSFKEAHTVHATWDEAETQVEDAIARYREFYNRLNIPVLISKRPDWDKFPGADYTIAIDTIMPDGRTLQIGTVHHLGDHFSKTFGIQYEDTKGQQQYCHQTCYGISERSIAALISMHGDDRGLMLPPEVAPVQIVIVPVIMKKREEEVIQAAELLERELKDAGYRVKTDNRDLRPGAKYYYWEMRGVPLRLEIGPRDLDNGVVMGVLRSGGKEALPRATILSEVARKMTGYTDTLQKRAETHIRDHLFMIRDVSALSEHVSKGVVAVHWCKNRACADRLEEIADASVLGTDVRTDLIDRTEGDCIICGKPGSVVTLVGRSY